MLLAKSFGCNNYEMNRKHAPEFIEGKIQLSIQGTPIEIEMSVPAGKVKPQRILPVLQKMTNAFIGVSVDRASDDGKEISCKAGCGACCRQLVPISKIEAYQLAELVGNLPAFRKTKITKRFKKAFMQLSKIGWLEQFGEGASLSQEDRKNLGLEYFRQNIPCPFLEEESCSIHPDRPLACREYLVTSPAENCLAPTPESIDMVPVPVKLSKEAYKFAKKLSAKDKSGFIPLISVLNWAQDNPDSFPEKPGTVWMDTLLNQLSQGENQSGSAD